VVAVSLASAKRCPYCSQGGLPPAPAPLYGDEATLNPPAAPQGYSDDDETVLPGQAGPRDGQREEIFLPGRRGSDDEETQPPARRGGSRFADEEDVTLPPERLRRRGILDDDGDEEDVTVIDREDTSLMGWLIVKSGPSLRRGHILKIRSGAIYGRSRKHADVLIDDEKVSSKHALIKVKEEKFILVDLGSTNGTFVNGTELTGAIEIQENDEIRIGNTCFVLKVLG
jgi:hypothetical protein